jgi:Phycobilisome protein
MLLDDWLIAPPLVQSEAVSLPSIAQLWAKKYMQTLGFSDAVITLDTGDEKTTLVQELVENLRFASARAWSQTETLLSKELTRHHVVHRLVDPWDIAKDVHGIYRKALCAYAASLGNIRRKYTAVDPRLIAFVALQFHYCGQELLLEPMPYWHRTNLQDYFKVIDDHLYMPLQRAYSAAAQHDYATSPALQVVRRLVPLSSDIARKIVARVMKLYPHYTCHSGQLNHPTVQISSIRDVEMFQTYLWVCILEEDISILQQELFPLCLMLYPALNVSWELVQQMIYLLGCEIQSRLKLTAADYYAPYYQALYKMFSPETLLNEPFGAPIEADKAGVGV